MPIRPTQRPRHSALTTNLSAMLMAVALYLALTYFLPHPATPPPNAATLLTVLNFTAIVLALGGLTVERWLVNRAATSKDIFTAIVISAMMGEGPAILGLLAFLATGRRFYAFFALSGVYFLRLFLRLPDVHRLMDARDGE